MSVSGTFATMPLPDLLQWLGETRRSGLLVVALSFEERYLRLQDGALVALGSDDPRARDLARLLLGRGLVDEARLRQASATGRPLAEELVATGAIDADALAKVVRAHAKDVVLGLFLWHEGRFSFSDAPSLFGEVPELRITPPIAMREVLVDGMRRLDEWRRIAEVLPTDYTVVHALGAAADLPVVSALHEGGDPVAVGDVCLRFARPRFEIVEELYEAWRRGLLAVDAAPRDPSRDARDPASPADVLVGAARTLVDERQWDEAAALLRSVLDLDPYHEEARRLLHHARGAQLEALYQEIPPYRVARRLADLAATGGLNARETYLFGRIDGARDVAALTVMTPLGELETLRALKKMVRLGLVGFR